ncbi:MAG: TIGR00730 family Rossman fold protein [Rhodovibrionaceae bacterium]
MPRLRALCVYCASSQRCDPRYHATAALLGRSAAERGVEIVYGGGQVGLMGAVADAALSAGGRVTGVIPEHLIVKELGHGRLTELVVVESMHERKREMFERADAFAILPGGLGTLDETFEILTWRQLGLHDKPIVLLNDGGYWQPLLDLIAHQVRENFVRPEHAGQMHVADSVDALFALLEALPGQRGESDTERF